MSDLILRNFVTDRRTLALYLAGIIPKPDEIKSSLFLAEREQGVQRPDHYYRNIKKFHFEGCESVEAIINRAFLCLVDEKLEWRDVRLYVKLDSLHDWQHLITSFPPLPLLSYAIFRKYGAPDTSRATRNDYLKQYIAPNLYATAIPSPYHPALEELSNDIGLHEVHQHLNGTTEADIVWLEALLRPEDHYFNLQRKWQERSVREQYYQLEPGMEITPADIYNRLRLAAMIRKIMVDHLLGLTSSLSLNSLKRLAIQATLPFSAILTKVNTIYHPLDATNPNRKRVGSLDLEGLFHVMAFDYLAKRKEQSFAHCYYLYLLLQGSFQQYIVQQRSQCGFDQFQRISENEFRSDVEDEYARRFKQLNGNRGTSPKSIEGRFAPKDRVEEVNQLVRRIVGGYARYAGKRSFDYDSMSIPQTKPQLRLIAHFIKKTDPCRSGKKLKFPATKVRHHTLRMQLDLQSWTLITCVANDKTFNKLLVGVDAASNELHAAPEVFAPAYRRLRRNGFTNFTYHVGEDFVHLLSGLRSIHEAINFLGLSTGNRIGHATAVGIEPLFWLNAVDSSITIARLEWLDNLVFTYEMLKSEQDGQVYLERLRDEIETHSFGIYREKYFPCDLAIAWKMRELDPMLVCYGYLRPTSSIRRGEMREWDKIFKAKQQSTPFEIFRKYHLSVDGSELIQVKTELIDANCMEIIQRIILRDLHKKGIVIETMPTSNVRISHYNDYSEHHIWRWLAIDNHERPALCVGSDDPGIFATNLFNEYAHIFQGLKSYCGKSTNEATKIVKELAQNASRYRFR